MDLKLSSFNLHGFRNGLSMLNELCNTCSLIGVQEHWLRNDELDKLALAHPDFNHAAVSGMDKAMSRGLLVGRPFGGIGFLWHNSLTKHIQIVKRDPEGRCMILKLSVAGHSLLVCNLYLPCFDGADCLSEVNYYVGFLTETFESVYYTDIVLLGDFNFELHNLCNRYTVFKHMLDRFNLTACSNFIGSLNYPTYVNDALGHKSHIDHFLSHPVFGISLMVVKWLNRV